MMEFDSALERICEYASVCSQSNYGNRQVCYDKQNCKTYWDNVEVEMRLWTWYQPEYVMILNEEQHEDDTNTNH